MSFDTEKDIYGNRLAAGLAIYPNACRYTVDGAFDKRDVSLVGSIATGFTGTVTVSGGEPLFFQTSDPYLKIDNEIIKITVTSATEIEIISRGQFGTIDTDHITPNAQIVHSGEADGSCVGYPKRPDGGGCSTGDSFSRTAEREFLFITGQSYDGQIRYNGLTLKNMTHSPVLVYPGEKAAKNATYSIKIQDNTDDDVYSVPYPDRRTSEAGLIQKLIARTGGYLQNRRAIVYTGFERDGNFNKDSCVAREYIIDSASLNNSEFSLTLLDPLMLAEASKTKIPAVSRGRLLNPITGASTTIELKDFVVGEYGANTETVTVIIDKELIECTVTDSATGSLAIVTRALGGSEQKDHSVNASVQIVIVLTDYNPVEEIVKALQTTSIDTRFYDDYSTAIASTQNATGPVYIFKPDSVSKYVNLIIRTWSESNISLFFSEREQLIKIKAVGDFEQQPVTLDYREDIKQDSLSVVPQYKKQLTRSTVGFAPTNAALKTDEENRSILYESINALTELTGTLEPQSGDDFYTALLTNSDNDIQIAVSGAARISNLNVKVPELFTFEIDYSKYGAVAGGLIEEAEIITLTTDKTIDDFGLPKSNNLQILSLKDNPSKATYTVKAETYQDIINEADFDFIINENKENYVLSDEYAPTEAGQYKIFVPSGVAIGATSTSNFAFDTGVQVAGVTFIITLRGAFLGAGGNGADGVTAIALNPGEGGSRSSVPGTIGSDGGDSLNLTVDCIIDVSQGVIFSGGGGAQSTRSIADSIIDEFLPGNGGSGGQGYVGGGGGTRGIAKIDAGVEYYGQFGVDGTRAAPGAIGEISGGVFGGYSTVATLSGLKSAPGYAIKSNGNNVILIGDNNLTIKGLRDF